ncbi:MAG: hypothetical protein SGJ01_15375, partial [Gemmatimonadota bacterium]|nr:hypothetical protein [Gemmatimonadota bacterium]
MHDEACSFENPYGLTATQDVGRRPAVATYLAGGAFAIGVSVLVASPSYADDAPPNVAAAVTSDAEGSTSDSTALPVQGQSSGSESSNNTDVTTAESAPPMSGPAPADVAPVDVAPADVAPVDVTTAESAPPMSGPAPVDVAPVDVAPVDVAPVDVAPADVAPVQRHDVHAAALATGNQERRPLAGRASDERAAIAETDGTNPAVASVPVSSVPVHLRRGPSTAPGGASERTVDWGLGGGPAHMSVPPVDMAADPAQLAAETGVVLSNMGEAVVAGMPVTERNIPSMPFP